MTLKIGRPFVALFLIMVMVIYPEITWQEILQPRSFRWFVGVYLGIRVLWNRLIMKTRCLHLPHRVLHIQDQVGARSDGPRSDWASMK